MKCPNCGVKNAADAKFCKSCGEDLKKEPSKEITLVSDKVKINDYFIKDRFKIIGKLGKGGMGEVFLCEDVKLKRKVAIKSIQTNSLSDTSSKARFLREAQTASQLDHPNICTVYEVYEEDYRGYIVMQYVDGVTLDQIIKHKSLSIQRTLDIALQICSGMVEAHENRVIHRDIKPGNIMVDRKGVVKILDFGLAKFKGDAPTKTEETNLTEKGIVLGTVSYLSPEQASGKTVDQGTDIFSFGILMFEMLEGKNPFKEEEQIETLYNVLNKEAKFTRHIPAEFKTIVLKALEKDKKKRYSDFAALKMALEQFRVEYEKIKDQPEEVVNGGTEVINIQEQQKMLKEIQRTSDNEGLGDLVHKIKKFKASTERVYSTANNRRKWGVVSLLLILFLTAGYFIVTHFFTSKDSAVVTGPVEKFYIFLHPFENKTGDRERDLPEKLAYLLTESLNQFKEFKVINREEAASILQEQKNGSIDLAQLIARFNVKYELKGEITYLNGFYTVEGRLIPLDENGKEQRLTITGKGKDSFLINQVDNLTRRVYGFVFLDSDSHEINFKRVANIFGTNWETFSDFYQGYIYNARKESDKARKYLSRASDLFISKYYLADSLYFEGSRTEASELIKETVTHIDSLTDPLKYRILALKARLDFDFKREILNREKLKDDFQFSKEVFFELGEAYFHHGSAEEALTYYKQALELDRNYSMTLNHMGYCYSYLGNHTRAIEAFEDYRTLDRTANSFDSLGDGYFYAGEYIDAENLKLNAVSTDEESVPYSYLTLADINIIKARYQKADQLLKRYVQLRPSKKNKAAALAKNAYIYYVDNKFEKALETLNLSIRTFDEKSFNDNTAEAHWLKGLILLALNRDEKSHLELDWLEEFRDKYSLSKENFSAPLKYYIHLDALLMEREGLPARAEESFKSLLEMKPRLCYWTTYYHYQFFHTEYAAFLMRNQRYSEALQEIDKCLEYNPNYIPALWLKATILEKAGDLQRFAIYNKISELYGESAEKNYLRNLLKKNLK
jgi:serine/threonine protein kinase/Flp pilus assembly protein TadD